MRHAPGEHGAHKGARQQALAAQHRVGRGGHVRALRGRQQRLVLRQQGRVHHLQQPQAVLVAVERAQELRSLFDSWEAC